MDAYTLPCDCCGKRVDEKTLVVNGRNYLCQECTIIELHDEDTTPEQL